MVGEFSGDHLLEEVFTLGGELRVLLLGDGRAEELVGKLLQGHNAFLVLASAEGGLGLAGVLAPLVGGRGVLPGDVVLVGRLSRVVCKEAPGSLLHNLTNY